MDTWNTILGGFLAAAAGTYVLFVQERARDKTEKHKVANALMNEMFHTLKFIAASHAKLDEFSKGSRSVLISEISQTFPSRRSLYVTIGKDIGALSEEAAEAAVNFDHYIQALERDYEFITGRIPGILSVDPETALRLAKKNATAIELTAKFVECMANEVGGTQGEATKKKIRGLKTLVGIPVD